MTGTVLNYWLFRLFSKQQRVPNTSRFRFLVRFIGIYSRPASWQDLQQKSEKYICLHILAWTIRAQLAYHGLSIQFNGKLKPVK